MVKTRLPLKQDCSVWFVNGLVIADEQFGEMKIRHMGYDFEALQSLITEMVEKLPLTVESMNRFKNKQLSEEQKQKFALEALGLRFDTENKTFNVSEFLPQPVKKTKGPICGVSLT
jgi:hypothetical protein